MSASPYPPIAALSDRSGEPDAPFVKGAGTATHPILNLAEAATFVRCSRAHLCNVLNGKVKGIPHLPTVRIGRRVLFRRESLERWLQELEASGAKQEAG